MSTATLDSLYRATGLRRFEKLTHGLPADAFRRLADTLAVSQAMLADSLGLSSRTLRDREGQLNSDEAERTFRVYRVFRRATEVLGDEDAARAWLIEPQRALGNARPLELLRVDVGTDEVLGLLGAIEDGGYL